MLTVTDFQGSFYGLKEQGTPAQPKIVPLVVIAWQPKGKGEPALSPSQLETFFFGSGESVSHWFGQMSLGRYRLVPHPTHPVIGPFDSVYPWPFYWRNDAGYVRKQLCGDPEAFCEEWLKNLYKVPPPATDPHHHIDSGGKAKYLDDEGFLGGHTHSWAEGIRAAAKDIDFSQFDTDADGNLSVDECLIVIVKAQASTRGFQRPVSGSDVPPSKLTVGNVTIEQISELYAAPPHGPNDLAVAAEEILHLAVNLADQYPDGKYRHKDDPGRPGPLSLTDAGHNPVFTDPFHRLKWGWLNPQLADHSGSYTLTDAASTGDALILFSPYSGTDEFFLLENRWRGNSYDRYRRPDMGDGLALWHCIQDTNLNQDWARRAVDLRRADPRLNGGIRWHLTLFDGNDPARGYDLHDDSSPQNLRFRDGFPSRLRVRNISGAGPSMTFDVEVPPPPGSVATASGRLTMLRAQRAGSGYGPPGQRLDGDVVVKLDTEPGAAFTVDVEGISGFAETGMLNLMRHAFDVRQPVRLEYAAINATGGTVIRVVEQK